jgi:hypothetical protein
MNQMHEVAPAETERRVDTRAGVLAPVRARVIRKSVVDADRDDAAHRVENRARFVGDLVIVDVSARSDPLDDRAGIILGRRRAHDVPTVRAVGSAPQPAL